MYARCGAAQIFWGALPCVLGRLVLWPYLYSDMPRLLQPEGYRLNPGIMVVK